MTVASFIEDKKLNKYAECYLNYTGLVDALNEVCRLEREKYYNLDFTIISPQESEDNRFHVIPVVSNDHFKETYQHFLSILRCELDRVDNAITLIMTKLSKEIDETKTKLSANYYNFISWVTQLTKWASQQSYPTQHTAQKLLELETELKLLRSNVITVNKFALTEILKLKTSYLNKSHYAHLLLEVELGTRVPPPTSPFPIKGERNRHHFSTHPSPPAIAITAASSCSSTESIKIPIASSKARLKNSPPLKLIIPEPPPTNLNTTIASLYLSPQSHSTPGLSSCTSYSSISSSHSSRSNYSREEIIHSVRFWKYGTRSVDTLIDQVKALRRTQTAATLKSRLLDQSP